MQYDFNAIETKWQKKWKEEKTYHTEIDKDKPKFYSLEMFPYPSGAGLHVGHPLGYIASDILARYKRHKGFNVLHPQGYDSFGLPAEQYAIQTGQHPKITTEENIATYRRQLDKIGFSYDWDREVRTSDPKYYKWTQWIFKRLFNSWYNKETDKAEPIDTLIKKFEANGTYNVDAAQEENWWKDLDTSGFHFGQYFSGEFTATDWKSMSEEQQQKILMHFRLAYLADSWVNWCPALGTVLANDEVKDGVSERGGHPVEQKLMRQWSLRITVYAERLLQDLEKIDWNDAIKEIQRNWIGKSKGASVFFQVADHDASIEVFTTRPDTIYGASFMVLAPEHELVEKITTDEQRQKVEEYVKQAGLKTERDRQTNVKNITGEFTGAYAEHPLSGKKIPIWIGDYVLAGYGTGAVMAVPAGDQRDFDFAKHFDIHIEPIFENVDISEEAYADKDAVLKNSDFLNGMKAAEAIPKAIEVLEQNGFGSGKVNYRLRDAVFSRQRYWGEPFPIYYKNEMPYAVSDEELPVTLPPVDKYLPTEDGEPPLARAKKEDWNVSHGDRMEFNTMPGWAGSSWYFLRYMDPQNDEQPFDPEKVKYWGQVDLYIGGAEHATGHLLYSRFWTKFLYDLELIPFEEPFKKMINQGMILGRSNFVYRIKNTNKFVTAGKRKDYDIAAMNVDIHLVENDVLDVEAFKKWRLDFADAEFVLEDNGTYVCGVEVEKMSKSKFNVETPDELVEKYGADTLRCYEMFLGPIEQYKPWDTQGITGVHGFLKKFWRLFEAAGNGEPTKENLKSVHKTIKKVTDDLERYSLNTVVSAMMIAVNELTDQKCASRSVLEPLVVLISPYAPHLAEEMWEMLGKEGSVTDAEWPKHEEKHLAEDEIQYPVQFNGKVRYQITVAADAAKEDVEKAALTHESASKYLEGKDPKKVIVVPKRIVNVVV
ncbi:leucine--tRNA ligase [Halocola ammonii]